MADPAPAASRRAVLGGLAGLVAASACDADDLRPPERQPSPFAGTSGSPEPDADAALVISVAAAVGGALDEVALARSSFPGLQKSLAPLTRLHRAHAAVLRPGAPPPSASPSASPSSGADLSRLRSTEQRLQQTLADAAAAAQSGALARLLASMSAAVAQHLAAFPAEVHAGERP